MVQKSLSNTELLAILINTGRKGFSSIDISNELLKSASNLNELKNLQLTIWYKLKGLDYKKAITLKAAFELGRMGRRAENNRIKNNANQVMLLIIWFQQWKI